MMEGGGDKETRGQGERVLTLPGIDAPVVEVRPRERSVECKALFEGRHGDDPDWLVYWELLEELRWPWRQAAYMAWVIMPRDRREFTTEEEFAVRELGLTSARVIRKWKLDADFVDFIKRMAQGRLMSARLGIWDALIESAMDSNPRNHPDRKMALEMLKDYRTSGSLYVGPLPENLAELSTEEKRARLKELRRGGGDVRGDTAPGTGAGSGGG